MKLKLYSVERDNLRVQSSGIDYLKIHHVRLLIHTSYTKLYWVYQKNFYTVHKKQFQTDMFCVCFFFL